MWQLVIDLLRFNGSSIIRPSPSILTSEENCTAIFCSALFLGETETSSCAYGVIWTQNIHHPQLKPSYNQSDPNKDDGPRQQQEEGFAHHQ